MKIDKVYSNKVTVKIAIIKFPSDKDLCTQKKLFSSVSQSNEIILIIFLSRVTMTKARVTKNKKS